jgi:hypothetical protein
VLGRIDGSLHLTVPSMNKLNQTDPATFCRFELFGDSFFSILTKINLLYSQRFKKKRFFRRTLSHYA